MTSFDAQFVERIVREVMRRLGTQSASPSVSGQTSGGGVEHGVSSADALVLDQRVVTLSQLDGKLQGVRRLVVPGNAVVTPSVRDLLRQKQVRLEQQVGRAATRNTARGLLVVQDDATGSTRRLAESLSTPQLPWGTCDKMPALVRQLQQATVARPVIGLAVTRAWARWVCQANREANVRAVAVVDQEGLRQACDQLELNLLVLDPTRHSEAEILALGRSYLQHWKEKLS